VRWLRLSSSSAVATKQEPQTLRSGNRRPRSQQSPYGGSPQPTTTSITNSSSWQSPGSLLCRPRMTARGYPATWAVSPGRATELSMGANIRGDSKFEVFVRARKDVCIRVPRGIDHHLDAPRVYIQPFPFHGSSVCTKTRSVPRRPAKISTGPHMLLPRSHVRCDSNLGW
jgi:hypothetical protein